jgi:hypothetical protein
MLHVPDPVLSEFDSRYCFVDWSFFTAAEWRRGISKGSDWAATVDSRQMARVHRVSPRVFNQLGFPDQWTRRTYALPAHLQSLFDILFSAVSHTSFYSQADSGVTPVIAILQALRSASFWEQAGIRGKSYRLCTCSLLRLRSSGLDKRRLL